MFPPVFIFNLQQGVMDFHLFASIPLQILRYRQNRSCLSLECGVRLGSIDNNPPQNVLHYNYDIIYRSDTVNSKSFVGKVLLRIKWKSELN